MNKQKIMIIFFSKSIFEINESLNNFLDLISLMETDNLIAKFCDLNFRINRKESVFYILTVFDQNDNLENYCKNMDVNDFNEKKIIEIIIMICELFLKLERKEFYYVGELDLKNIWLSENNNFVFNVLDEKSFFTIKKNAETNPEKNISNLGLIILQMVNQIEVKKLRSFKKEKIIQIIDDNMTFFTNQFKFYVKLIFQIPQYLNIYLLTKIFKIIENNQESQTQPTFTNIYEEGEIEIYENRFFYFFDSNILSLCKKKSFKKFALQQKGNKENALSVNAHYKDANDILHLILNDGSDYSFYSTINLNTLEYDPKNITSMLTLIFKFKKDYSQKELNEIFQTINVNKSDSLYKLDFFKFFGEKEETLINSFFEVFLKIYGTNHLDFELFEVFYKFYVQEVLEIELERKETMIKFHSPTEIIDNGEEIYMGGGYLKKFQSPIFIKYSNGNITKLEDIPNVLKIIKDEKATNLMVLSLTKYGYTNYISFNLSENTFSKNLIKSSKIKIVQHFKTENNFIILIIEHQILILGPNYSDWKFFDLAFDLRNVLSHLKNNKNFVLNNNVLKFLNLDENQNFYLAIIFLDPFSKKAYFLKSNVFDRQISFDKKPNKTKDVKSGSFINGNLYFGSYLIYIRTIERKSENFDNFFSSLKTFYSIKNRKIFIPIIKTLIYQKNDDFKFHLCFSNEYTPLNINFNAHMFAEEFNEVMLGCLKNLENLKNKDFYFYEINPSSIVRRKSYYYLINFEHENVILNNPIHLLKRSNFLFLPPILDDINENVDLHKLNIYSLGLSLLCLITNQNLCRFNNKQYHSKIIQLVDQIDLNETFKNMFKIMLDLDQNQRASSKELLIKIKKWKRINKKKESSFEFNTNKIFILSNKIYFRESNDDLIKERLILNEKLTTWVEHAEKNSIFILTDIAFFKYNLENNSKIIFNYPSFLKKNNYFPSKLFFIEENIILGVNILSNISYYIFDENNIIWNEYNLPFDSINLISMNYNSFLSFSENNTLLKSLKVFEYNINSKNWNTQTLAFKDENYYYGDTSYLNKNILLFFISSHKMILFFYKSSHHFTINMSKLEIKINPIEYLKNDPKEESYKCIYKGIIEEWNKELFVIIFFSNNQKISYLLKKLK